MACFALGASPDLQQPLQKQNSNCCWRQCGMPHSGRLSALKCCDVMSMPYQVSIVGRKQARASLPQPGQAQRCMPDQA